MCTSFKFESHTNSPKKSLFVWPVSSPVPHLQSVFFVDFFTNFAKILVINYRNISDILGSQAIYLKNFRLIGLSRYCNDFHLFFFQYFFPLIFLPIFCIIPGQNTKFRWFFPKFLSMIVTIIKFDRFTLLNLIKSFYYILMIIKCDELTLINFIKLSYYIIMIIKFDE